MALFDKSVEARLFGVTMQDTTVRIPMGDSSLGVFTAQRNPLRGTLVWNEAFYVLQGVSVAGGATGGSYTVTLETDAVVGYTGLPIARAVLIGPLSPPTVLLSNLHQADGSPLPTHLNITKVAGGASQGIWFQCHSVAKQYRGVLATPGLNTSERVLQGNLVRAASYSGSAFVSGKGFDASQTVSLTGASATQLGLQRMRIWDNVFYWAVGGVSVSGQHRVTVVSKAPASGVTFAVAANAASGLSNAGFKVAIPSLLFGVSPNPTALIWTVDSAGGVSDARVVVLAKTGRGTMAKQ